MKEDKKSFRALVSTQFLGAFNDNLFKQLMLFLAAGYLFSGRDVQGLAFAVFSLPFVLFSGIAGDLSERFSKRTIIIAMKVAEIGVMLIGIAAFALLNWAFMLVVLFLMGMQSAVFGPSKYGVIPELVPAGRLLRANGIIAMTTFLSVLLGQALAGPLLDGFGDHLYLPAVVCVLLAILGTATAWQMAPLKPQNPAQEIPPNPFGHLLSTIRTLRGQQGLFRIVLLYSLFWFNGSVIQQSVVSLGEPAYLSIGIGEKRLLSYVLVTLSLAIISGSVATPMISKRLSEGRTVFLGAGIMVLGQLLLLTIGTVFGRAGGGMIATHLIMVVIGFSGALFVVPVQTYLQHVPEPGKKGQTFAVNNFMNFLFMFFGGIYYLTVRSPLFDLGPTAAVALSGAIVLFVVWLNRHLIRNMSIDDPVS